MHVRIAAKRRKDGAKWYVVVDMGRQPAGRCPACRWLTWDTTPACAKCGAPVEATDARREVWHRAESRDAARRLRADLDRQAQHDHYLPPSKLLAEAFLLDEWLPAIRHNVKPTTWETQRYLIETQVLRSPGPGVVTLRGMPLQSITAVDLNKLYAWLKAQGRVNGSTPLSAATVRRVHTVLHKAFADAIKWGQYGLLSNPATKADPPKAKHDRSVIDCWDWPELSRFLATAQNHRLSAAWWLLACTGMRRGEVLGLHWDDIDFDARRLSVRHTTVLVRGTPAPGTPKGNQARVIDLAEDDITVLRRWKVRQAEERLAWGADWRETGLVFSRPDGSAIHPNVFAKQFGPLCTEAGVRRIRLHDLRHTHATLLLRDGIAVKVVQERLGHADPATTLRTYAHVLPGQQEAAVASFAARRREASA